MSNQNIINPKDCSYGCNTRIYWNNQENAYFGVFSQKRHICPNRVSNNTKPTTTTTTTTAATSTNRPFYNKKPWIPKPKMSNSFEYLQGSIAEIQMKYETLSDIVTEHNGKVHGSQRDRDSKTGLIDLLVYYEVPLGMRDEVKREFENFAKNKYFSNK